MVNKKAIRLPVWVPDAVRNYLVHTVEGRPIRTIARASGCHASTVLRQIRRVETRRDDPLIDAALDLLARPGETQAGAAPPDHRKDSPSMTSSLPDTSQLPDASRLEAEAERILRRMCETGALLAIADKMEKAVVVRNAQGSGDARTATVDVAIARAFALRGWISCDAPGRISRYRITPAGRTELNRIMARKENLAREEAELGFAESQKPFEFNAPGQQGGQAPAPVSERARKIRYNMAESPLTALARRKDRDGSSFLSSDLVVAGERLREDFELSQTGPRVAQNWDSFLVGRHGGDPARTGGGFDSATAARDRVARALEDLGPGLGDVALRCCCYLEGLETAERKLGWSARSGKIVLRIALQRLRRHYDTQSGEDRMIG